ncbi:coiled-coil domain-containing protein [Methylomonas methanica]|uniref:DUF1640 domain-containing protein n=1 Tax=Methylomonas methanica TaxID=421 RepID=A0A177LS32_METMH|nr:coiled-coil domain-containing protein [Methylomonas methanica]OAH96325.1 hypothetical protein A1332_23000 [Methylomonas methanica]
MATVTFDTHKFVRKLKEAGFDEKQAEAVSEAFRDAQAENEPLTKKDLQIELAPVRSDLVILKWMLGLVFATEVMPLLAKLLA